MSNWVKIEVEIEMQKKFKKVVDIGIGGWYYIKAFDGRRACSSGG